MAELAEALMQIYDHGTQPNAIREARALMALLNIGVMET